MKHWKELLPKKMDISKIGSVSMNHAVLAENAMIDKCITALTGKACLIPSVEEIAKKISSTSLTAYEFTQPHENKQIRYLTGDYAPMKLAQSIHDMLEGK